ncbi:hypothetical protein [Streptomyces sp. NPDC058872]|uniref:hypothetical protein n=1 Tax=Streptomyces sp. NPDC058872 TaxID=3346661 RepID=UPI0036AB300D
MSPWKACGALAPERVTTHGGPVVTRARNELRANPRSTWATGALAAPAVTVTACSNGSSGTAATDPNNLSDQPEVHAEAAEGKGNAKGEGVLFNGVEWTKPGDKAVHFLHDGKNNPSLISSQGRVVVTGKTLRPTAGHDDKLRDDLGKTAPAELASQVKQAPKGFHTGDVTPLRQ